MEGPLKPTFIQLLNEAKHILNDTEPASEASEEQSIKDVSPAEQRIKESSQNEISHENSSDNKDQYDIEFLTENVSAKLKHICGQDQKFSKIIDSMVTDSNGNIIIASNDANQMSLDPTILMPAVLEMVNISAKTYDMEDNDYICKLDSKSSMLISPIDYDRFFIVRFIN
jgi:hypothetical protein